MIFNLFSKNIHYYPTLSSLAFSIFRSNFMQENKIPQISGKIAKDIRQGYTGGSVDIYIPESKVGKKIKCYDVNSLYPSQMHSQLMPVGIPNYFNGRFGMDDNFDNINVIHKDYYSDFENKYIDQITEKIELDNY